jgi:hypothetical protein
MRICNLENVKSHFMRSVSNNANHKKVRKDHVYIPKLVFNYEIFKEASSYKMWPHYVVP